MKKTSLVVAAASVSSLLVQVAAGLNILMSNDDGFGASNLRELYRLLVDAGHDVWVVAPAVDNSGKGGSLSLATSPTLTAASGFGLVPAGSPSLGPAPDDDHIWYYNGTPSVCTMIGLDYVLPTYANFSTPDLFVSGPNFGNNVGTFAFTGSGTIGAAYTAILRNIPAVAFSGANAAASYATVAANGSDPATLVAEQAAAFLSRFVGSRNSSTQAGAHTKVSQPRLLPLGYGLNVNIPALNSSCTAPPVVVSRFSGGSGMPKLAYNASTGLVGYAGNALGLVTDAANVCYHGDCTLPGESEAIEACQTAVTVFTVDYDASENYKTGVVYDAIYQRVIG